MAQAKASIVVGDADSTPDGAALARPDSSKMRVRLDDSSQISKDQHLMSALSGDSNINPRQRGISPERFTGVLTPESNFEDESMHGGAQANAFEFQRLRDENMQLKEKLRRQQSGNADDAPLAMTTFSPARDSNAAETNHMQKGLNEIGRRLLNLMRKVGCNTNMHNEHDISVALLKDFIYEIDEKMQQLQQRTASFDTHRSNQPTGFAQQQSNLRQPHHASRPALTDNLENSGYFGHDTTMDMTKYDRDASGGRSNSGGRGHDIKSQLLDEKEKRLTIQETLTKTKEEQYLYKREIDALKTELRKRPQISTFERKVAQ